MLKDMEDMVIKVILNLKTAQDKQKSYTDLKRAHKEFKVGDYVYLRVKPSKSSLKLGSCAKLAPRYWGPFEVLDRIGPVAYRIALLINMRAHNVFHVSLLKKYVHDPNHVIDWNVIQVDPEGEFQVDPIHIFKWKETTLWNRVISQLKVQWKHLSPNEVAWELESAMDEAYPFFFNFVNTEDGVIPRGQGM